MSDAARWLVPAVLVAVVVGTLAVAGGGLAGAADADTPTDWRDADADTPTDWRDADATTPTDWRDADATTPTDDAPCRGNVTEPAEGGTLVSVQGARGAHKKPPRLVGVGERGRTDWVHRYGQGTIWGYDVDPLPNGNVFVTTTIRENDDGDTVVFEYDPQAGERVWQKRFDALDTHDADLIDGGEEIVVANMRNTGEGEAGDRIFVYNRTQEEITWEWRFAEHFDESVGGDYEEDWTHVNDVDAVGDDQFLISPRNFDQVLVINRTTKEIDHMLGVDGNHDVLKKQHNPDYLEGPDGEPTILVADSENDRVVEYAKRDGEWVRTWELTGDLKWPRDADRLPNGNTLVVDSRNHRVLEVTPDGEVVWESYTPWLVYDAERLRTGDGSNGPTIAEQGERGNVTLSGDSDPTERELERCAEALRTLDSRTATPYPEGRTTVDADDSLYGTDVESPDGPGPLTLGVTGLLLAATFGLLVRLRTYSS